MHKHNIETRTNVVKNISVKTFAIQESYKGSSDL